MIVFVADNLDHMNNPCGKMMMRLMFECFSIFLKLRNRSQSDYIVNLKSSNTYNFQVDIQKSIAKLKVKVLDLSL